MAVSKCVIYWLWRQKYTKVVIIPVRSFENLAGAVPGRSFAEAFRTGSRHRGLGTAISEIAGRGLKNRGSCFHHCVHPGNVFIEPSHFLMLILKGFKNFPKLHIRTRTDTMRKSAHIRANLNAYAHICRHTRTHAHIRTRMSTYAHIRTHAHAYARVRTQTHTYAQICAHMQNAGERSMSQVS